jgi:hypothetical protein
MSVDVNGDNQVNIQIQTKRRDPPAGSFVGLPLTRELLLDTSSQPHQRRMRAKVSSCSKYTFYNRKNWVCQGKISHLRPEKTLYLVSLHQISGAPLTHHGKENQ